MKHILIFFSQKIKNRTPILIIVSFLLIISVTTAKAQNSITSLQKLWSYQFDKGQKIDGVAFAGDDSGNPQKVLVKLTQNVTDQPVAYYDTHPSWQEKILSFSFEDGQKNDEKIYTVQGDNGGLYLSPNGDVWSFSSKLGDGTVEKNDGTNINLDFLQSHTKGQISFSSKGSFAILSDDSGWAIRDENGNLIKYNNSEFVKAAYFSDDEKFIVLNIPNHKLGNQLVVEEIKGQELFRYSIGKESFVSFAFSTDGNRFAFTTSSQLFVVDRNGILTFQKPYRFKSVESVIDDKNMIMSDAEHLWIENSSKGEQPFKESGTEMKTFMKIFSGNEILMKYGKLDNKTYQGQGGIELTDLSGKTLSSQALSFAPAGSILKDDLIAIWGINGANNILMVFKIVK